MVKLIGEKNYEKMMRTVVEPGLAAMREVVEVPVAGGTLHAEVYNRFDAKRALVIVHGYTECAEKYRELCWYFVSAGYSVFVYDQRGHGSSVREVEDLSVTHVERFDQYVDDLVQLMETVVRKRMGNAPVFLYGHSMGGAVAARMLMEKPDWFAGAVLNAPMIKCVTGGLPSGAAELFVRLMGLLGKGKERAVVGKPFDPERETFEGSHSTGRARFDYFQKKRVETPHYQNCSPTNSWLREGIAVTRTLLKAENAAKIRTPVLLVQAGLDSIVCLPEQERFVSLVEGARLLRFDEAKHEIYMAHDALLEKYMQAILSFFAGEEND
ncbi:MAG: alpha/beta hydrolase [Clostridia bacterium]|nr:alpha/beta hydrolase [Clostridia bacterium]